MSQWSQCPSVSQDSHFTLEVGLQVELLAPHDKHNKRETQIRRNKHECDLPVYGLDTNETLDMFGVRLPVQTKLQSDGCSGQDLFTSNHSSMQLQDRRTAASAQTSHRLWFPCGLSCSNLTNLFFKVLIQDSEHILKVKMVKMTSWLQTGDLRLFFYAAFDTTDENLLKQRLEGVIGFTGTAAVDDEASTHSKYSHGKPQGCVFGPILFSPSFH